jgi:hypothetical protein
MVLGPLFVPTLANPNSVADAVCRVIMDFDATIPPSYTGDINHIKGSFQQSELLILPGQQEVIR